MTVVLAENSIPVLGSTLIILYVLSLSYLYLIVNQSLQA